MRTPHSDMHAAQQGSESEAARHGQGLTFDTTKYSMLSSLLGAARFSKGMSADTGQSSLGSVHSDEYREMLEASVERAEAAESATWALLGGAHTPPALPGPAAPGVQLALPGRSNDNAPRADRLAASTTVGSTFGGLGLGAVGTSPGGSEGTDSSGMHALPGMPSPFEAAGGHVAADQASAAYSSRNHASSPANASLLLSVGQSGSSSLAAGGSQMHGRLAQIRDRLEPLLRGIPLSNVGRLLQALDLSW